MPPETILDIRASRLKIIRLALPVIAEMTMHTLVWIVDTAMVGRLGAAALSAVGLGGQMYWSIVFACGALGVGITALIARFTGADDKETARLIAGQGITLAVIIGSFVLLLGWLGIPFAYRMSGLGPVVSVIGISYTRIICVSAPAVLVTVVIGAALRGTGNTRTPLMISTLMILTNIVLDYLLIFGYGGFPRLEAQGAAIASVIAQIVALVAGVIYLLYSREWICPRWHEIMPLRFMSCVRIMRISMPAAVEAILLDGARLFNLFVIAVLGTISFAAFQITIAAESLSFMPGYAFAVTASILAGQNLGAGRPDLARREIAICLQFALIFMGAAAIGFLTIPHVFVQVFTPDTQVQQIAARCLRITAAMQLAIAAGEVYRGAIRGAGDTGTPLRITVVCSWFVRVPMTVLAVRVLGLTLEAVFWIITIEWWLRAILLTGVFRRGRWLKTTV